MTATYATLQFFVDWHRGDGLGMNTVPNSGFEANTTGWKVDGTLIGAAATSITRRTEAVALSGEAYVTKPDPNAAGAAIPGWLPGSYARVVTPATTNAGASIACIGTHKSGRTYRYAVAAHTVSGATTARLTVGSLGTVGDRITAAITLTSAYQVFTVDWTPSGDRADACIYIGNGAAASAMTFDFEDALVYEAINDITADVQPPAHRVWGANFDGSGDTPATLEFTLGPASLVDLTNWKYAPANTSSVLSGMINAGRRVWVRAKDPDANIVYPYFYGTIDRFVPRPDAIEVDVFCVDPLEDLDHTKFVQKGINQNVWEFRDAIITDAALDTDTAIHKNFDKAGKEGTSSVLAADDIFTFAAGESSLSLLTELNKATGTIHFCMPEANSDLLYRYTTVRRQQLVDHTSSETWNDDIAGSDGWDVTRELFINKQTVQPHQFVAKSSTTRTEQLNISIAAGASKYYYMTFDDFVTGSPTPTPTPATLTATVLNQYPQALDIKVTNSTGAAIVLTQIAVPAVVYREAKIAPQTITDTASQTANGRHKGDDIDSVFCQSRLDAISLAQYKVDRYSTPRARPSLTVENRFPTHLTRMPGDRVRLTLARMSLTTVWLVIRGGDDTVDEGGRHWVSTYQTEEIP